MIILDTNVLSAQMRDQHEATVEQWLDRQPRVSIGTAAAEATAVLLAKRREPGRGGDLRDGMVAGIAIARHATLATRNIRRFADLAVSFDRRSILPGRFGVRRTGPDCRVHRSRPLSASISAVIAAVERWRQ